MASTFWRLRMKLRWTRIRSTCLYWAEKVFKLVVSTIFLPHSKWTTKELLHASIQQIFFTGTFTYRQFFFKKRQSFILELLPLPVRDSAWMGVGNRFGGSVVGALAEKPWKAKNRSSIWMSWCAFSLAVSLDARKCGAVRPRGGCGFCVFNW